MRERIRQMFCGITGHDALLKFERDRMFLRCVSCGHETPGWDLNETPPTVRSRADKRIDRRGIYIAPRSTSIFARKIG